MKQAISRREVLFISMVTIQALSLVIILNDLWLKDVFWLPRSPSAAYLVANGSNFAFAVFPNQAFFILNNVTHNVNLAASLMTILALGMIGIEFSLRKHFSSAGLVMSLVGASVASSLLVLFF